MTGVAFGEQVVLVTGGTRGIGRAIAARLARSGARLWLTGTDAGRAAEVAREIDPGSGWVHGIGMDLTDRESIEVAVKQVVAEGGGISVLVNNAGLTRDRLLASQSSEEWRLVMEANLDGLHTCCRAAIRPMIRARYGRIVNMSSIVALRGNAGQTAYATAKAGIIGFTRSLAREVARRNITVNAIAPGFIETAMTEALPDAVREESRKRIAMQRFGTPDEVAAAAAFLASREASYITGSVLEIHGGLAL